MRRVKTRHQWLALIAGCVLLLGCGPAGSAEPATSGELPSPFAGRVNVSGTAICDLEDVQATGSLAGVRTETATMRCNYEMSDPRVTASEETKLTMHWVTAKVEYFLLEDDVLTNDGGTWRGRGWGSEYFDESGALFSSGTSLFRGEGDYDGLSYRLIIARHAAPEALASGVWMVSGWIEPTD